MASPQHLLIFGASARAAAFSALRAGLQPWCADLFADADALRFKGVLHDHCKHTDKAHGRLEIRHCWTISDPDYLACIKRQAEWLN